MVVKINNKSDFKINEWSESIALEVPFEFIYYIPLNKEKYVASYDGHSYINCVRLADGSLDVIFNNHGLGIGRLKVVRKYFVDDLSFADGVFDVISDDQTDVFLTSGKTFDTYVKTLVVPPYLKGDKGDPMTWETMTEKERGELVKDIAEDIDPEMVMTENEKLRQEAEQGRQTAEQQRSTTFNTLKGEMQSAITAGNAAARNAQKVVDEYDEKVSEQDSKLSELGLLLNSKTEATTEINKICNIKTGEITIHNSFSIQKLEISDNAEKIVMPSYWGSNSLGNYDGAAFFDKNMNHLGYAQGILGATWSVSLTEIPLGMIPSGTKYVVTTSNEFKDSVGYCEQSENVAKELGELKEKIKNIENDLESDIKNYIEHNYTLPTYQDEALGKNLFNKNGDIYSDFVYADGNSSSGKQWDEVPLYTSGYFATTYAIAVEGGKELTISPTTNDAIYIAEYAADGSFVKSTKSLAPSTTIKLDLNTRYIRVPFVYTALNKLQVEYGSKATSYEEYKSKKVISLDDLPKEVTDVVRKDDVEKIVGEQLKEQSYQGEIVLPKTLYNMVGRKSVLYISQFCKGSEKVDIKLSATGAENVYSNSILFQPQTSGVTYWSYIHLLKGARIVSSQGATINNIAAPSLQKNVKIMTIGDSLTDLGFYQSHLTRILAENKVSCKWIGTQHRRDYEDVSFEAKSGGNLSYIATDYNVAKIIEVSGIVVPPSTGYGSTEYTDGNGNKWRVNGHILTESNGSYSGKIRLVKYERDQNYEGGDAGDTTGSNLPSSGVLTKSNNGEGDRTINYNLISTASENPLWNPQTKEVDWNYYFTTWGLDVPNIVILQFGYNEIEDMSNTNSEGVQIAVSRLKGVIEKLHEQYPNVKIIVGLEIYGANSVGYYNKHYNSAYPRKFAQLSLYQEWMKTFENYSHVVFAPIYARMDDVRGYGLMTEIDVNDNVYENPMKETVRVDGFDGVHPPFDYGQKEIAMTYEPIIISMI